MSDETTRDEAGRGASRDGAVTGPEFRLGMVPGVNPDRWVRVWEQRNADVPLVLAPLAAADALGALRAGDVRAALVRLPIDRDGLDVIPLYTEATSVVVPKDHLFTAADEVHAADLADEVLAVPADDVLGWADAPGERFAGPVATGEDAMDLVAAGHALLVAPHSIARLHQRRGTTTRPVVDAPGSGVGLAWLTDGYDELTEELIGIVRGRTAASSRGRGAPPESARSSGGAKSSAKSSAKGGATSGKKGGAGAPKSAKTRSSKGKSAGGGAAGARRTPGKGQRRGR